MRKTMILMASLFITGTAMAQNIYKTVTVNCSTPNMMAGGASTILKGKLAIIVSPTTGMTKVQTGSELQLTLNRGTGKIKVQGIYFGTANHEHIEGSVDEDRSPFSTVAIDFTDSQMGQRSYIQRVNGQILPLTCSH